MDYVYRMQRFVQPGETLTCDKLSVFAGGKGLNQSVALAYAGADVVHCGFVSRQAMFLVDTLENAGVDTSLVQLTDNENGHAIIQVLPNGENCIIVYPGTNYMQTDAFVEQVAQKLSVEDLILFQNECGNAANMMKKAKVKGARIVLNPSPMNTTCLSLPLELVDIFLLNEVEGREITHKKAVQEIVEDMHLKYPTAEIVLTLGKQGMIYCGSQEQFHVPATNVGPVVDTTAAGDTFTGYFLALKERGATAREAALVASRAAGIAVTRKGASISIPRLDEVVSGI